MSFAGIKPLFDSVKFEEAFYSDGSSDQTYAHTRRRTGDEAKRS